MHNKSELFLRTFNDYFSPYTIFVKDKLTVNKLKHWSHRKTIKLFDVDNEQWYLEYRFYVLRKWFEENYNDEILIESKLSHIIKSLKLEEFLDAREKKFLLNLASNRFTKLRNIKSLITNFDLLTNEKAFFHYLIEEFIFNEHHEYYLAIYITNLRIVVILKENIISFYFDKITNLKIDDNKLSFSYFDHEAVFISNKMEIIETSLKRIHKI